MSDPFGIPLGSYGGPNPNIYPIETGFQADLGPSFDEFVPIASPTPEQGRLAEIEEDKRRRNTEASARFRVKKKEREKAMEKAAAEMTDKVGKLEDRVRRLELENSWLRELITEKNAKQKKKEDGESKRRRSKKKRLDGESDEEARSPSDHTDGVGTGY